MDRRGMEGWVGKEWMDRRGWKGMDGSGGGSDG